jgi:hypothetical protein
MDFEPAFQGLPGSACRLCPDPKLPERVAHTLIHYGSRNHTRTIAKNASANKGLRANH